MPRMNLAGGAGQEGEGKKALLSRKMEFILMDLNDIKMNKIMHNDMQEKLHFLVNFIQKQVIGK